MWKNLFKKYMGICIMVTGIILVNTISASANYNYYLLPQSSSEYLDSGDISGMSQQELNYARNEIYAKHGRCFQSQELTDYFEQMSWYSGTISPSAFDQSCLNQYEQQNAEYLKSVEYYNDADGYALDQAGYDIYDVLSESHGEENDFILPDSNSRYLKESDIAGLSAKELCYARNEIYARHGRCFVSSELAEHFDGKSWYHMLYTPNEFPTSLLSAIEVANIDFLKEREYELCPGGYVLDQTNSSGQYTADQASRAISKYCERYLGQGGTTYVGREYQEGNSYILWFRWGTGFHGKYVASLENGEIYETGPYVAPDITGEIPLETHYVGNIDDFI